MSPPFNENGWLPDGIYDCTMDEAADRFGGFQSSDRRTRLWARFTEFIGEVKGCGLVEAAIGDPGKRRCFLAGQRFLTLKCAHYLLPREKRTPPILSDVFAMTLGVSGAKPKPSVTEFYRVSSRIDAHPLRHFVIPI